MQAARGQSDRVRAWSTTSCRKTVDGKTIADSIDVHVPRNWRKAVRAIRESDGVLVTASDEAILDAMRLAGRHGVFAEPAAAAALAGVVAAIESKMIGPHERVLVMITGSGLKDTRQRDPRRRPADRDRAERRSRRANKMTIEHRVHRSKSRPQRTAEFNMINRLRICYFFSP